MNAVQIESKKQNSTDNGQIKKLPPKIGSKSNTYWENRYLILLLIPGLIYFLIFKYGPMYGLLMAFKDYSFKLGVLGSPWAGLKHFENLFNSPDFLLALKNTVTISFLKVLFGFSAPVILALMINEIGNGFYKRFAQTISYLPHFFSWVVLSGLVIFTLSPSMGVVNKVIQLLGGQPIYFLADTKWFVPILIITDIWKEVGWGSIIYLAALSGMNPEIQEAAIVDGANRWKRIIYINLPGIASTIAVMLILRMGSILDAGFDQIFNLYSPPVYNVSDIIDTYIYRIGIVGYQYSFSTAAGMFKAVIGLAMVVATNFIAKRISDDEFGIW